MPPRQNPLGGITGKVLRALWLAEREGRLGIRGNQIATELGLKPNNVTYAKRVLIRHGLLTQGEFRRGYPIELHLTHQGRDLATEAFENKD